MIGLPTLMALAALVAVAIAWLLPPRLAMDGVAVWTASVLAMLSWQTALWLVAATALTNVALALGERSRRRGAIAIVLALLLVTAFVTAQIGSSIVWIGSAFFTLRLLHVIGDWWKEKLAAPTLRRHLRYQLFLPVLFIGPIHRIETFERQVSRRRWDATMFLSGAERVLFGFFLASVMGNFAVAKMQALLQRAAASGFLFDWGGSALAWFSLYFVFSGLTSVALGLSLMIGLQLEENFNAPWRAVSLVDFWTRWHMSLTSWCRDYVFKPVTAITRSALAGLVTAMLVIGLWHELSTYYLLWSVWQSLGVVLNRLITRFLPVSSVPEKMRRGLAPLLILGWLSLARPVILGVLELLS